MANNTNQMVNPDPGLVALRKAANLASKGLAECTRCHKTGFMKGMAMIVMHNMPLGALCMDCAGEAMIAATGEGGDLHVRVIERDAMLSPSLVAVRARDAIGEDKPIIKPDVEKVDMCEVGGE